MDLNLNGLLKSLENMADLAKVKETVEKITKGDFSGVDGLLKSLAPTVEEIKKSSEGIDFTDLFSSLMDILDDIQGDPVEQSKGTRGQATDGISIATILSNIKSMTPEKLNVYLSSLPKELYEEIEKNLDFFKPPAEKSERRFREEASPYAPPPHPSRPMPPKKLEPAYAYQSDSKISDDDFDAIWNTESTIPAE